MSDPKAGFQSGFIYSEELANFEYSPTHPFKPVRAKLTLDLCRRYDLIERPWIWLVAPKPLTVETMAEFHDPAYLKMLKDLDSATLASELWPDLLSTKAGDYLTVDPKILRYGLGTEDNHIFSGMFDYSALTAGATLIGAKMVAAGEFQVAFNPVGGFHHAGRDHAEGFCYVNDIAVAIRRMRADGRAARVAVVDLDVHQGNATAFIFRSDPSVFTFSMHQENNYPVKQPGMLDVGLEDGIGDEDYLGLLDAHLPEVLDAFRPELVVYLAGADPLAGDQLGGLALTLEGLRKRDDRVIGNCARRRIPVAGVLGGGYAQNTQDTVRVHHATCRVMWESSDNAECRRPNERRKAKPDAVG